MVLLAVKISELIENSKYRFVNGSSASKSCGSFQPGQTYQGNCACTSYFKRQERLITKTMIFQRYNGSKLKEKGSFFLRWRVGDEHERLRSEEHTSELQSHLNLVCRLLLENNT